MIAVPTRLIMASSSLCLVLAGAALLFAPAEALAALGMSSAEPLLAQLLGAAYLGAAAANWTARGAMIGGIYARPLSVGNYVHFVVGTIVLAMGLRRGEPGAVYFVALVLYAVFGACFTLLLFGGPGFARHRGDANE